MIHGPCGKICPKSPCMETWECTKNYPKALLEGRKIDKSRFVLYRRRHDPKYFVIKGDIKLDNQYVVPHNLSLLKKTMLVSTLNGVAEKAQLNISLSKVVEREKKPSRYG